MGDLTAAQIDQFIRDGFVKIDSAFARELADEARSMLWKDTGCDPEDVTTWTRPVIRLGMYSQEPFIRAANTSVLHQAFDQLVGSDRWLPCRSMGTFPIRFPSSQDPGDVGWHIDASFEFDNPDFLSWRANVHSRGRMLLMLFIFSDVGKKDAPTRLRVGSHRDIARLLAPAGEAGLSLRELAANRFQETAHRQEVLATGEAGTVYLCHPFLVHSAQPHHGVHVRFMAQPPLLPRVAVNLKRDDGDYSPVEWAIRQALDSSPS